jgi:drug/metabolite transporter superfamily protein YnfA
MTYASQWEFEIGVILLTILVLLVLRKSKANYLQRFGLAFLGVLIFEYFTHPLWVNQNLQRWSFLYLDVNWIITLCWVNLILISLATIDYLLPKLSEGKRFFPLMGMITIGGLYLEWLFLRLNIRAYPAEIQAYIDATYRIANVVPVIEILYIPVFMGLIIGFIRYWEIVLSKKQVVKKSSGGKRK